MRRALLIGFAALAQVPVAAPAQELKRLFFSPAERLALDAQRRGESPRGEEKVAASIRLDGTVQTARGRATVWVNGRTIVAGKPDPATRIAARVDAPGAASLTLGPSGEWVGIRAGVDLDLASGAQRDLVSGGAVRVRR